MRRKTKKRLLMILLVLVVGIGLVSFLRRNKDSGIVTQDHIEAVDALTMEEKLEDLEYLYSFIENNYPLLRSNERLNGIDWLGEKENFKKSIEITSTDEIFMNELKKIVEGLNDSYTNVVDSTLFKNYYDAYVNPEIEDDYKPWAEIIKDERTLKRYRFDESQLKILEDIRKDKGLVTRPDLQDVSAFKSDIIIPGEVAYLKIESMNLDRIEKDGPLIREFLKEVKDYNKLIIDVRRANYWIGDKSDYWIKNIVEPLIDKEISVDNYLLRRGEYGMTFQRYKGMEFAPVRELSDGVLSEELKRDFDYYSVRNITIDPVEPIGYKGKIYVIIDRDVAMKAEDFAAFCKDSNFATLIGEVTSGMNHHFENILFALPNSGLIIDMRDIVSLNSDGTIREEVNVVPHIEIDSTTGSTYDRDQAIQYIIED